MKRVAPRIASIFLIIIGLISCSGSDSIASLPLRFGQLSTSENSVDPVVTDNQLPIQLGMSKEVIVSTVSIDGPIEVDSDLWQIEGNLGDIGGRWTISFSNNKVSWFAFSSFDHQVNEHEFIDTLSRTQEVVEIYSRFLGNPRRVITGITQFKDPSTHQHQGYQVFQAQWEANGSRIVVDFSFVGEGRDYGFLVTVQGS